MNTKILKNTIRKALKQLNEVQTHIPDNVGNGGGGGGGGGAGPIKIPADGRPFGTLGGKIMKPGDEDEYERERTASRPFVDQVLCCLRLQPCCPFHDPRSMSEEDIISSLRDMHQINTRDMVAEGCGCQEGNVNEISKKEIIDTAEKLAVKSKEIATAAGTEMVNFAKEVYDTPTAKKLRNFIADELNKFAEKLVNKLEVDRPGKQIEIPFPEDSKDDSKDKTPTSEKPHYKDTRGFYQSSSSMRPFGGSAIYEKDIKENNCTEQEIKEGTCGLSRLQKLANIRR